MSDLLDSRSPIGVFDKKKMLTTRGLSVDKKFVLQGKSFTNLLVAIKNIQAVPDTKEKLTNYFGISAEIMLEGLVLGQAFISAGEICDRIIVLAASAPQDYDEIFDGLKRLYKDEADNTQLRNAIRTKINARLDEIREASSSAESTRIVMAAATDAIDLAQRKLRELSNKMKWQQLREQIQTLFWPDFARMSANIMAMNLMNAWLSQIDLTSDTNSAMEDLQRAVGAFAEIDMDLVFLRDYVEEDTSPGIGPILDLQKGNILEMWEELEKEAKEFKSTYVDVA
ncbi:hypothetical protein E4U55_002410 [Claviceps digitariae]|nr:hypothetical protein E4U55_002410 [Claviceps digitariae]